MHASAVIRPLLHGVAAALLALSLAGCSNEVVIAPKDPDAGTPPAEGCDGHAIEEGRDCVCMPGSTTSSAALWSKRFGIVDSAGPVLLAGSFDGTADFGNGPLTSAGAQDVFVAKLNP